MRTGRDLRFTVWAQDPCVVLQAEGETVVLTPAGFERQQDAESVALLARTVGARLGFTVHELASFHAFTQRFKALHCIAKALDRRPGP